MKNFFTLYAANHLKLNEYKHSEGLLGSNATVRFDMGLPSRHTGDVWAVGNINVQPKNIIQGNLASAGNVYVSRHSIVSGVITEKAGFSGLTLPVLTFANPPASARSVLVVKDKAVNIALGIYNVVRVEEHGVLRLRSGVYTMNNLRLGHEASIALNLSAGPVTINVANILSSSEEVAIKINSTAGTSRDILINYEGTTPFYLGKESQLQGNLVAPNARVVVSIDAIFKGAICAREIEVLDSVRALANKSMSAGHHEVFWNGRNHADEHVAAGIYVYRLTVEPDNGEAMVVMTKKMTFVK